MRRLGRNFVHTFLPERPTRGIPESEHEIRPSLERRFDMRRLAVGIGLAICLSAGMLIAVRAASTFRPMDDHPAVPSPHQGHRATLLLDGSVLVTGGLLSTNLPLALSSAAELYSSGDRRLAAGTADAGRPFQPRSGAPHGKRQGSRRRGGRWPRAVGFQQWPQLRITRWIWHNLHRGIVGSVESNLVWAADARVTRRVHPRSSI